MSSADDIVELQSTPLDVGAAIDSVGEGGSGAIAVVCGDDPAG